MDQRRNFAGIEINPTGNEVNLMPDSNRDGIFNLAQSLSNNVNWIITGVNAVITPAVDATVVDGYVLLDGEVLKVDAQTVTETEGSNLYIFQKLTTDGTSPDWDRLFRDGATHNIFKKNRAVVVNVAAIGGDLSIQGAAIGNVLTPLLLLASSVQNGLMSIADFDKLATIATGAEVNVNADWDSASGDSEILNKPISMERIGITAPAISFTYPSVQILNAPGNTVTPTFGTVIGECKVANNGYVIGDRVQFSPFAHSYEAGAAPNTWGFFFEFTSLTVTNLRISQSEMYMVSKTTGDIVIILSAQWDLEVSIWGTRS